MDASSWTCEQVSNWMTEHGFNQYAELFSEQHKIDGVALLALTERDLREPPLCLPLLGDIKRIGIAIEKLQDENGVDLDRGDRRESVVVTNGRRVEHLDSHASEMSFSDEELVTYPTSPQRLRRLKPEYVKLFIAFLYMSSVLLLTAYVMVVVHDRVPDMTRYPPLPDLMLDNLPYIPWAFELCEVTALSLSTAVFITLAFHKHRFIILRRLFVLTGTLFLLRCFTMWITSLSVPGTHLKCFPQPNSTVVSQFERAFVIWKGAGMSIQGVRSCGDYMFSGHTVVITLLNFFLTEYTPRNFFFLHMCSWVCNLFGLFFILAAHEHYSIDVFIGFYITSRLFLYYHSLANNCALRQQDGKRTRNWFPLFSFFESKTDRIVPNEYEWPIRCPEFIAKHVAKEKTKIQ